MAHLIDKSALVTGIERKIKYAQTLGEHAINSSMQQFYDGMKQGCVDILSSLDTLEVKEVDLKEEIESLYKEWRFHSSIEAKYRCEAYKELLEFIGSDTEEPVSEELEQAAVEAFKKIVDDGRNSFLEIFKAGAKWKETQMTKDATEVTVHIEAGNYPYIPQIELYDYDKDEPLAKKGDKYKVVLIKE